MGNKLIRVSPSLKYGFAISDIDRMEFDLHISMLNRERNRKIIASNLAKAGWPHLENWYEASRSKDGDPLIRGNYGTLSSQISNALLSDN